ncbi:hypothetical protein [uncultured Erythrobacter sp.]|uniref:DUF6959 family protein n=1 Tax=uncultured Erythrobacter sp. TaxID=263913 RepID=UPI002623B98A|nr:hypothetical protein [uncultured Erythrobacter sp.]
MDRVAKLVGDEPHSRIVHLPERRFPGVVFQGDTLHSMVSMVRGAMKEKDEEERYYALKDLEEILGLALEDYKATLSGLGMELPFFEETD